MIFPYKILLYSPYTKLCITISGLIAGFIIYKIEYSIMTAIVTLCIICIALVIAKNAYLLYFFLLFCILFFIGYGNTLRIDRKQEYDVRNKINQSPALSCQIIGKNIKDRFAQVVLSNCQDTESNAYKGKILLQINRHAQIYNGQIVNFKSPLKEPPVFEDFSYKDYLYNKQIYALVKTEDIDVFSGNRLATALDKFKNHIRNNYQKLFPEPQSALIIGLVLGLKENLPKNFESALQRTGTTHMMVVSGFNISIIAGIAVQGLKSFGKRKTIVLALSFILLYTSLVGFSPPVMRAAIMGSCVLIAELLGRQHEALYLLLLSAIIMIISNPYTLLDISFQLSFMATFGIIILSPLIEKLIQKKDPLRARLIKAAMPAFSAQIFVIPILINSFGTISPYALLSNVLISEIIPLLTFAGIGIIPFMILRPLAQAIAWWLWIPLTYVVKIIETLSRIPGSQIELNIPQTAFTIIWYALLALIIFVINKQYQKQQHEIEIMS